MRHATPRQLLMLSFFLHAAAFLLEECYNDY